VVEYLEFPFFLCKSSHKTRIEPQHALDIKANWWAVEEWGVLSGLCNLTSGGYFPKEFTTRTPHPHPHPYPCSSLPAQFGTHLERKVSFRVAAFSFGVGVLPPPLATP